MAFDWEGFERELADALVEGISGAIGEDRDVEFGVAALYGVYEEFPDRLGSPFLAVGTRSQVGRHLSPSDWECSDAYWLGDVKGDAWSAQLVAEATQDGSATWNAAADRYFRTMVAACRRARVALTGSGAVAADFLVLVVDDRRGEELLRLALDRDELDVRFPHVVARERELAAHQALDPAERAEHLVNRLVDVPLVGDAEEELKQMGGAAVPALAAAVRDGRGGFMAVKLLADIGLPEERAVTALTSALNESSLRGWAAVALSRLGHLQVVLDAELPQDVVARAIAAPFSAFRDHAINTFPLDYEGLERVLAADQSIHRLVADELRGSGCQIRYHDVEPAIRALQSPEPLVRLHATNLLDGPRERGDEIVPLIYDRALHDPDERVRWAGLRTLKRWAASNRRHRKLCDEAWNAPPYDG